MSKRKPKPFNNPFAEVGERMKKDLKRSHQADKKARLAQYARPRSAPAAPSAPASDEDLFAAAVRGAARLEDPRGTVAPPLPPPDASSARASASSS